MVNTGNTWPLTARWPNEPYDHHDHHLRLQNFLLWKKNLTTDDVFLLSWKKAVFFWSPEWQWQQRQQQKKTNEWWANKVENNKKKPESISEADEKLNVEFRWTQPNVYLEHLKNIMKWKELSRKTLKGSQNFNENKKKKWQDKNIFNFFVFFFYFLSSVATRPYPLFAHLKIDLKKIMTMTTTTKNQRTKQRKKNQRMNETSVCLEPCYHHHHYYCCCLFIIHWFYRKKKIFMTPTYTHTHVPFKNQFRVPL